MKDFYKRNGKTILTVLLAIFTVGTILSWVGIGASGFSFRKSSAVPDVDTDSIEEVIDTLVAVEEQESPNFETKLYTKRLKRLDGYPYLDEYPYIDDSPSHIEVDFPISGNDKLLHSIKSWICESLRFGGLIYKGDVNDVEAMLDFYSKESIKEHAKDHDIWFQTIKVLYEDDLVVTFSWTANLAETDLFSKDGATFRKTDGKIFTESMIDNQREVRIELGNNLHKEMMKIINEEEIHSTPDSQINEIILPSRNIIILDEGFFFDYVDTEIKEYLYDGVEAFWDEYDGGWSCCLSPRKMKKYLTEEGRTFVK